MSKDKIANRKQNNFEIHVGDFEDKEEGYSTIRILNEYGTKRILKNKLIEYTIKGVRRDSSTPHKRLDELVDELGVDEVLRRIEGFDDVMSDMIADKVVQKMIQSKSFIQTEQLVDNMEAEKNIPKEEENNKEKVNDTIKAFGNLI